MTVYFLLLVYIFAIAILIYRGGKPSKQKNKVFVVMSFLSIVILESLRAETVGIDTNDYIYIFNLINRYSWIDAFTVTKHEVGYVFLNKLVGTFTSNPQFMLFAVSLLMMMNFGYFIYHNTDENEYAIWPVYFWITLNHLFTSMVSLRQYLALSIAVNIYTVLKKEFNRKNVITSVILLLVAMSFHTSAIFCILYFVVLFIKQVDRKIILLTSVASAFILTFFSYFENLVLTLLPRYVRYREYQGRYVGRSITTINIVFILLKIAFAVLVFMLNPKREGNKDIYRLGCLSIISAEITTLTTQVYLLWRVGYYYDIFMILLIPKVLKRVSTRTLRVFCYIAMIMFGLLYYYRQMYYNSAQDVPYRVFF